MPTIEGLPTDWTASDGRVIDLSVVPASPSGPDDPHRLDKVVAWEAWAHELHLFRDLHQGTVINDRRLWDEERVRCKRFGPKYVKSVWCSVHEPRSGVSPLGAGWLPALPFPFQVDVADWLLRRRQSKGAAANRAMRKSRDMGGTWDVCLEALCNFLGYDGLDGVRPYSAKFISRREDLVDIPGNLDSMMERIAAHLNPDSPAALPAFLLPRGYDPIKHRKILMIRNPENGNILTGESTSAKSGRGSRSEDAIVDEGAFIEKLRQLLASLMQTAAHVLTISSESRDIGDDWDEYCQALKALNADSVLELDYWLHPYHDEAWLADQRERYANDEEGFAREIMRIAVPGGGWYYPNAQDFDVWPERITYEPGNPLFVGIDPGDADDCAIHWIMCNGGQGWDALLESYERSGPPPEHYAAIILGCDPDEIEDHFPALRFTALDRELMAWTRTLPQPVLCGDPAGTQTHGGDSWYEKLQRFALDHNPRKNATTGRGQPLTILVNWQAREHINTRNPDQGRRIITMNWLPRLRFNDTPEVRRTLYAIQRSRFEPDDRPRMAEQKRPVHDALSHRRSALEYVAVNLDVARLVRGRTNGYDAARGTRDKPSKRSA